MAMIKMDKAMKEPFTGNIICLVGRVVNELG